MYIYAGDVTINVPRKNRPRSALPPHLFYERKQYDEDLFADSTMTFGEHLEELRMRLWKAILGLMAGIIIGMFLGGQVVNLIQRPLTNALSNYYQRETEAKIAALTGQNGDNAKNEKEILEAAKSRGMIADDVYVDPRELLAQLDTDYPQHLQNIQLPKKSAPGQADGLVHVFLWRKSADDPRVHLKSFSVWEGFGIYVKAAILVGLLLASPWIFYQIWIFVAAGLYPHEKKYVHFYLPDQHRLVFLRRLRGLFLCVRTRFKFSF